MKSLSLSKPHILVMVGLPGSGKSFFARQFSDTFGAPLVSYDKIRHTLFETPQYNKDEIILVKNIAEYQENELLKTQKTFIVDGGADQKIERSELRKRAQKAGYDVLLIWVQTDENTAKYRSMKRSRRQTYDQLNQSLTDEQYSQLVKRFTAPTVNENSIVISGKHTYAAQARVVLKKLVAPREAAPSRQVVSRETRLPQAGESDRDNTPHRRNVLIR